MSRRQFLGCSAGALALGHPLVRIWQPAREPYAVLDLGGAGGLRESIAGYASALGGGALRTDASTVHRCSTLIVPAAIDLPTPAASAIAACLRHGGMVILESGAGFASERAFRVHRSVVRDAVGVDTETPVSVWGDGQAPRVPYVDLSWPIATKIRDFSRVVPLGGSGEVIARVNGRAVGIKRDSGQGTLIVLGSPLGPALWAGDAEARRWLTAALAWVEPH